MKYATTDKIGRITLPKQVRQKLKLAAGKKVVFIEKNSEIIIKPMNREYFESFAGLLKGDVIGELMREKEKAKN